jgi:predicted helicase
VLVVSPFTSLLSTLPHDPHSRGRAFERLCQWLLLNDPVYAGELRQVWLWGQWPGRWGPDAGIDLVAKTTAGDLWAIQAKAYDPQYAITKRDLDTFLSESARPEFAYRLIIATTDKLAATARRTLEGQAVPVGLLLRSRLEKADICWPEHIDALAPYRAPRKQSLPHNEEAVRKVCQGFSAYQRGQLIMACGTGKTLVGLWVAEKLRCRRTLARRRLRPSRLAVLQA